MNVSLKIDAKRVTKMLESIATNQIQFASAQALNNVAFIVKDDEVKALDAHLDRPTPFTKKAYEVIKANRDRLRATVQARGIQNAYLEYQVFGGSRGPKSGRAIVVPAEIKVNAYGNMTKGAVKSLLSSKTAFSGKVGGVGGIYKRRGRGKDKTIDLMVRYQQAARYSKRLPFHQVAAETVGRVMVTEFNKALGKAISSAR